MEKIGHELNVTEFINVMINIFCYNNPYVIAKSALELFKNIDINNDLKL